MTRIVGLLAAVLLIASTCLADEPKDAAALVKRGDESRWNDEYDKAIADYTEAIRLIGLADAAKQARADKPAGLTGPIYESPFKHAFEKKAPAVREDPPRGPQLAAVYLLRGHAWGHKREYDKAIADFSTAVQLDPKNTAALLYRAYAWDNKHDFDRAIADFDRTLELDPRNGGAYSGRGHAWTHKGEYDKAIADFDECIRLNPKDDYAFRGRADVWKAKQKYAAAIADYDQAVQLRPEVPYGYSFLAWIWATCPDPRFRNGKKAVEYAIKACELSDWQDAMMLSTLAAAYAAAEDFDEAIKWQEKAIELSSGETKTSAIEGLEWYKQRKPRREEPKALPADNGLPGDGGSPKDDGLPGDDNEALG